MLKRITIRQVKEADLPAIKVLLQELTDSIQNTSDFDLEQSVQNCQILLKESSHHMLVARDQGSVVGFINFSTRKTIMHAGPSGLVDELVVSKNCRGSGIGKQLILAAIDTCRKLGCNEVEVSTEKSNTRARHFYKGIGFEEDAVLLEIVL